MKLMILVLQTLEHPQMPTVGVLSTTTVLLTTVSFTISKFTCDQETWFTITSCLLRSRVISTPVKYRVWLNMYSLSYKQKLQCYFDPGVLQLATSDANCDLTWFSSEVVTLELAVLVGVLLNKLPSVVCDSNQPLDINFFLLALTKLKVLGKQRQNIGSWSNLSETGAHVTE